MAKQAQLYKRRNAAHKDRDNKVIKTKFPVIVREYQVHEHNCRESILPSIQSPRQETFTYPRFLPNLSLDFLDEEPVVSRVSDVASAIKCPLTCEDYFLSTSDSVEPSVTDIIIREHHVGYHEQETGLQQAQHDIVQLCMFQLPHSLDVIEVGRQHYGRNLHHNHKDRVDSNEPHFNHFIHRLI